MDILVIEDDRAVAATMRETWPSPEDTLTFCYNVASSRRYMRAGTIDEFDALILDVNLPDGNGIEILFEVRRHTSMPVVFISGRGNAEHRATSIDMGANDYVMKPFNMRELRSRVARLVSTHNVEARRETVLTFFIGPILCDMGARVIVKGDQTIELTTTEAELLRSLAAAKGAVRTKPYLTVAVFAREHRPTDNSIDVYISRLRKKFAKLDLDAPSAIQTVHGRGYRLVVPENTLFPERFQE